MGPDNWIEKAQWELGQAEAAWRAGNEGKARVCARRAAGHIAGEYLARRSSPARSSSAMTRLQKLAAFTDVDPQVREVAEHFLLRITPDHSLPVDVDLIAEARWLAKELLGETIQENINP